MYFPIASRAGSYDTEWSGSSEPTGFGFPILIFRKPARLGRATRIRRSNILGFPDLEESAGPP